MLQRIGILLLFGVCLRAPAAEADAYLHLGPVERITNGIVTLGVAPRVGRIVSFRRSGGTEWLKVNDVAPPTGWNWNPWGGDRVWPTCQLLCQQIYGNGGFDPVIDGGPWEITGRGRNFIELLSGGSQPLGIRIRRRIELPAGLPAAVHTFRLESIGPRRFPVHLWTVTEIREPEKILLETDRRVPHAGSKPFRKWPEHTPAPPEVAEIDEGRSLAVGLGVSMKIGTYGRWIAALRGGEAFLQSISYDPKAVYLEASSLQIYAETKRSIYEIETLSPTWFPGSGGDFSWVVRWELVPLSSSENPERSILGALGSRSE